MNVIITIIYVVDAFMSDFVSDPNRIYENPLFNNDTFLMGEYMNFIDESGRRYDPKQHVKRTSQYFTPGLVKLCDVNKTDILPDDSSDHQDMLLEDMRDIESLNTFMKTSIVEGESKF